DPGASSLSVDAAGLPVKTTPGQITIGDPQTITYANIAGVQLLNAAAVNAAAGPDTADRGSALAGLTAQERFVQVVYLDELGRPGSLAELDGWVALLNAPGGSQASVASAILHSAEARDNLVKSWYVNYLGRQANGVEELGWVNLLLQGQSEE